jgi:predicted nucleotidyltransferase
MLKKENIIQKIVTLAISKIPDSEIYLYGSRARGDNNRLSDWDLLVLLNSKNIFFEYETKIMDEFYELELETGQVFSPLIYSKTEWEQNHTLTTLYENIQQEGIRIK